MDKHLSYVVCTFTRSADDREIKIKGLRALVRANALFTQTAPFFTRKGRFIVTYAEIVPPALKPIYLAVSRSVRSERGLADKPLFWHGGDNVAIQTERDGICK